MSLEQALELLRTSRTFALLMDRETALYRECASYVFEFLKEEHDWC